MKHFIFGMDSKDPAACARMLRERGYHAVVNGDFTPEAAAALEAEGLEMYLSYGAYSVGRDSAQLAQDPFGQPRGWFSSGCPNDPENAKRHLDAVLDKAARMPGVRGILVDGARFASFASTEGVESFFTCFCPRCMQAMTEMGLDAEAVREAVKRLMESRQPTESGASLIRDWLRFREKTVQDYMDLFAQRVHALRGNLLAGAFIFAPSLGLFVGQTMTACRSLDVISHMLYRDYPHDFGVACLGHEWSALAAGFSDGTAALLQMANAPFVVERTSGDLRRNGFAPEWIGKEVTQARKETEKQLWPIIQLQDGLVLETAQQAFQSGADAVGLFAYGHAEVPHF